MHHAWTKNEGKDLSRGISEMAKVQQSLSYILRHILILSVFLRISTL